MTTTTTQTTTTCKAWVADPTLPSNTSQVRPCRNHTHDGAKFCATHQVVTPK